MELAIKQWYGIAITGGFQVENEEAPVWDDYRTTVLLLCRGLDELTLVFPFSSLISPMILWKKQEFISNGEELVYIVFAF